MKKLILSVFLTVVFINLLSASETIMSKKYDFRGGKVLLEVVPSLSGSDIILKIRARNNLSYRTPGENLFPKMFINGEDYSVTWINYTKNDVKLNLYDSFEKVGRSVISGGFKFISGETLILYNGEKPRMILFRGIKDRGNEDIFIHDINSGKTVRISDTPGNENTINVDNIRVDGRNTIEIKTQTLKYRFMYKINPADLSYELIKKEEIIRKKLDKKLSFSDTELNTIIGFGDSITWGKMRMDNLVDSYHPELTYWAKTSEHFNENYGTTYTVNLGVNRDSSLMGVQRMDENLLYVKGYFFLVLFGTNDVTNGLFSAISTSDNIKWILENARDNYGMFPVVSTVPPQRLYLEGVQFYKDQTEELNELIKLMAIENGFPYIDTYTAFFENPEGWEAMLEDEKGNHPSPKGHMVMANMVIPILLKLNPKKPENISFSANSVGNSFNVRCSKNYEFDFSHYLVTFGFSPTNLDREYKASSNQFNIYFYPFNLTYKRKVYFKFCSVDKDGNKSDFTEINSILIN